MSSVDVDAVRSPPREMWPRVLSGGAMDATLHATMSHSLTLFTELQKAGKAMQKEDPLRDEIIILIRSLRDVARLADNSWGTWAKTMLDKNDIGYAMKIRERQIG